MSSSLPPAALTGADARLTGAVRAGRPPHRPRPDAARPVCAGLPRRGGRRSSVRRRGAVRSRRCVGHRRLAPGPLARARSGRPGSPGSAVGGRGGGRARRGHVRGGRPPRPTPRAPSRCSSSIASRSARGSSSSASASAQLAARDTRDVKQRPQGTRGGQGVTGRRQRTHPGRKLSAEVAQQRGLADTGLAVHERQPTGRTAYSLQTRFQ